MKRPVLIVTMGIIVLFGGSFVGGNSPSAIPACPILSVPHAMAAAASAAAEKSVTVKKKEKKKNEKVRIEDLAPKYRHFLELIHWISTDRERDTFLRLKSDRLRDRFMELFWRIRDPSPGTPENEYKDEIERRFNYANRRFRFASIPGWKTDRGRVYIKLGKPISTERFSVSLELYDTEVWYYYGAGRPGLPSHFSVLFFRPRGVGDYKQYSYVTDGPYELLIHREGLDPFNYEALYDRIREIEPTLAPVVLSPIPGEIPFNFQPTPEADQIMARIMESPVADIDDSYALKFERYAGMIELEEANRYIQATFYTRVHWMPDLGFPVFQYAIQPSTLSIGQIDERYYIVFEVNLQFSDPDTGKPVFQVKKKFYQNFTNRQLDQAKKGGILLQDAIPLLPGVYEVKVLVKNPINKEFSFFETTINVPPFELPRMDEPILAYESQPGNPAALIPFQQGIYRYMIDLKNVFVPTDRLILASRVYLADDRQPHEVRVRIETDQPGRENRVVVERKITTTPSTVPNARDWSLTMPLIQINPGRYRVITQLKVDGRVIGMWQNRFSVSPARGIARPVIFSKSIPWQNIFVWNLVAGDQAANRQRWSEAIEWYRKAVNQRPNYFPAVKRLLDAYIMAERYSDVLEFLAKAKVPDEVIQLYRLLAMNENAIRCKEHLPQFVRFYNKGHRHWRLLREIGLCLIQQGKLDEARPFIKDTLNANPNQKDLLQYMEGRSRSSGGAIRKTSSSIDE